MREEVPAFYNVMCSSAINLREHKREENKQFSLDGYVVYECPPCETTHVVLSTVWNPAVLELKEKLSSKDWGTFKSQNSLLKGRFRDIYLLKQLPFWENIAPLFEEQEQTYRNLPSYVCSMPPANKSQVRHYFFNCSEHGKHAVQVTQVKNHLKKVSVRDEEFSQKVAARTPEGYRTAVNSAFKAQEGFLGNVYLPHQQYGPVLSTPRGPTPPKPVDKSRFIIPVELFPESLFEEFYVCGRKTRYSDSVSAKTGLERNHGTKRDEESFNVYECKFCAGWHYGHAPKNTPKANSYLERARKRYRKHPELANRFFMMLLQDE